MSFVEFFIIVWPTYTVVAWWFCYERTFDELLGLLARLGVIMGGTGFIATVCLTAWDWLTINVF